MVISVLVNALLPGGVAAQGSVAGNGGRNAKNGSGTNWKPGLPSYMNLQ